MQFFVRYRFGIREFCVEARVPAIVDQGHRREELKRPAKGYVAPVKSPRIHACMHTCAPDIQQTGRGMVGTGGSRGGDFYAKMLIYVLALICVIVVL